MVRFIRTYAYPVWVGVWSSYYGIELLTPRGIIFTIGLVLLVEWYASWGEGE